MPNICLSYDVCILLGSIHTQIMHLGILSTKAILGHVERITQSTHDSSIQIRFKLDRVKSVQVIAPPIRNQTASRNSIQLSRTPIFARVWQHTQLVSQILGDPLCLIGRNCKRAWFLR